MSRNENDNTDHISVPNTTPVVTVYDKEGKQNSDNTGWVCAQSIYHPVKNLTQYYVLYGGNQLYNPESAKSDVTYHKRLIWKLKSVSARVFNQYVMFLETKKNLFLRNAERDI